MARIIAVVSQKGGVGKTTTAVNLASAFAREGREVLLMEIDPQGAVLPSVGCDDGDVRHSLADVLLDEQIPALSAVLSTPFDGISVVPAIRQTGSQELDLQRVAMDHPLVLREVMDQLAPRYDVVLIDCPPTLGPLMRLCLAASDSFLVPVQAEEYSYRTLERLLQTTDEVQHTLNPDLTCEGLLLTMVDLRTRMSVRVVNQLHENYGDKVLMGMVPRTVTLQEMPVRGRPTVVHAGIEPWRQGLHRSRPRAAGELRTRRIDCTGRRDVDPGRDGRPPGRGRDRGHPLPRGPRRRDHDLELPLDALGQRLHVEHALGQRSRRLRGLGRRRVRPHDQLIRFDRPAPAGWARGPSSGAPRTATRRPHRDSRPRRTQTTRNVRLPTAQNTVPMPSSTTIGRAVCRAPCP